MDLSVSAAARRGAPAPPGPSLGEIVRSRLDPRTDRLQFFLQCARRYGGVVRMSDTFVLLNDPALIEHVLRNTGRGFAKYNEDAPQRLLEDAISEAAGHGTVDPGEGLEAAERRMILPAFHRERISAYGEIASAFATEHIAAWRANDTRDVYGELARLAARTVSRTLFGFDLADHAALLIANVETANDLADHPIMSLFPMATAAKRRMHDVTTTLNAVIAEVIAARRGDDGEHDDLLGLLLATRRADGSALSDRHIRNLVVGLLVAGYANPSATLSWAFVLLAEHPDVDARLAAELRDVLGGRAPSAADLARLPYTTQVLRETMRLYSSAWTFSRVPTEDTELGGFAIPQGTTLGIMPWVTHRDERYFGQPDRFDPDRWVGDWHKQLPRCAYYPFSTGPRGCIGSGYGMMVSTLVLATVVQRFRLRVAPGHRVRAHASLFTLRPKGALPMVVERRS